MQSVEPTHSMLMAARKRLTNARRKLTRANNNAASKSGLGPLWDIAKCAVEVAELECKIAEDHYNGIAAKFSTPPKAKFCRTCASRKADDVTIASLVSTAQKALAADTDSPDREAATLHILNTLADMGERSAAAE